MDKNIKGRRARMDGFPGISAADVRARMDELIHEGRIMENDNNEYRGIRKLPKQEPRMETGAVIFGSDWPGVFIRGDDIPNLIFILNRVDVPPSMPGVLDLIEYMHVATGRFFDDNK